MNREEKSKIARKLPTGAIAVLLIGCCSNLYSQSINARFDRFDKDNDGKLSADELPYEKLFKKLDKNGDNFITKEEAKALGTREKARAKKSQTPTGNTNANTKLKPREHGVESSKAKLNSKALQELDIAMEAAIANEEVSGIVGLVFRNGHRGYFESFGWQNIEESKKMPKDAIFRLQSMSKPVVTVAALTLYEEGKFELDEPIENYLPEWKQPQVLENGKLVVARTKITPRMLMSHSSGLYYGSLPGHRKPRERPKNLDEYSKILSQQPLKFHPGEGYSYGTSIDILARLCEVVAGKPLDKILSERIFTPLKMNDTDFWVPIDKSNRIAQVYRQPQPGQLQSGRSATRLTVKPTLLMGGQGLCSTTTDYEQFCLILLGKGELNGVRILSENTVNMMFENQLKNIGHKYGLGGAASGDGGYGWGGANGTQFWIDRRENMFGIFMIQAERYRPPTYKTFRSLVMSSLLESSHANQSSNTPTQTDRASKQSFVGKSVAPNITWKRSLQLPKIDKNGMRLTGTEIMELAAHNGALYAGNSHWNSASDDKPTQVFVLKSPDEPWQVDVQLPPEITRTTYLKSVTFQTDSNGEAIEPKSVLILGVNRKRIRNSKTPAVVFVRNDSRGQWEEHVIGLSETTKWAVGVRSIGFHRDSVTGLDTVFLGVGPGAGIFSGKWNSATNKIEWSNAPEFKPIQSQRVMDFAVCDGTLYAATQKVLYRRVKDGPQPQWETILEKRRTSDFVKNYSDDFNPG